MVKRAVKILAFLIVAIVVAVPGAALLIDDETLSALLQDIPGVGEQTDAIIARKRSVASALATYAGDAFTGLDMIYLELFGSSSPRIPMSKVVIDLPPGSKTVTRSQPDNKQGHALSPSQPPSSQPPPLPPAPEPTRVSPPPAPVSPAPAPAEPETASGRQPSTPMAQEQPKPAARKAAVTTAKKTVAKTGKKAARNPSADQDHKRGLLFYKGIGVDKDFKKAAQWFKQAAKKGHAGAQYNLGIMSYLGQGVPQDYTQAVAWFEKAGEQDHAGAQYNLGFIYYEGKGVEKDDLQAYMWIDRSASLGDEKAIRARETLQKALPKEIFK